MPQDQDQEGNHFFLMWTIFQENLAVEINHFEGKRTWMAYAQKNHLPLAESMPLEGEKGLTY